MEFAPIKKQQSRATAITLLRISILEFYPTADAAYIALAAKLHLKMEMRHGRSGRNTEKFSSWPTIR